MPYILIGEPGFNRYAEILSGYDFIPFPIFEDPDLNKTVRTHADTLIFSNGHIHITNDIIAGRIPEVIRNGFTVVSELPHGGYPTDTVFNALPIGRYLFARLASLAPSVRKIAEGNGMTLINVNQGYARCSTLALPGARAAITADAGMARAMQSVGIDVLEIRPGHIALEGCDYGFIGGASFVYEPQNCCSLSHFGRYVYFFGDIRRHPDGEAIIKFIENHGYDILNLGGELTDFGSAVVIENTRL